jgi:Delta6-protoilludene synthase
MPERYYIPNNLDQWKWPRHINPHYAEVKAESAAWAKSFEAFSPKAQEAYDRCDFSTNSYGYSGQVHALTYCQTASHVLGTLCMTRVGVLARPDAKPCSHSVTARTRSSCDLMHIYFVFDEYSDAAHEDDVQVMANIVMDALRNPHKPRPEGEWVGGEMARQ